MKTEFKGSLFLLGASLIWGLSFVAQKLGMDYLTPFAFNGIRSLMGALFLLPFILHKKKKETLEYGSNKKNVIIAGICCGLCLFFATNLQQIGIIYTTAGKSGFITAMYIVLVPIIGIFLGKRIRLIMVISLVLAVVGLFLLCIKEETAINKGDMLVLLCAVMFAIHILIIDSVGNRFDPILLSSIQFMISGSLSVIVAFLTEDFSFDSIVLAFPALVFTGVFSSGIAYTLQILGQKTVPATMASLLMSLESVFAVFGAMIIMHERMSLREAFGCVVMFVAVIISQLPDRKVET